MRRNGILEDIHRVIRAAGEMTLGVNCPVEVWNANIDFLEEETPFELPAVFVEFGEVQYEPVKGGDYGTCEVILHVAIDSSEHGLSYCLELCDDIVGLLSRCDWYRGRLRSLTNHNHGEIIDCVEVVKAVVY